MKETERSIPVLRAQLKRRVWLRIAFLQAELATCNRLKVGCVLLDTRGHVLGTGYNGSLPGRPHCAPDSCNAAARCLRTQHAERNALDHSTGDVVTAYVTDEPCLSCTKDLLARGCRAIYYHRPYDMRDEERRWRDLHAREGGCTVQRLEMDGTVVP